MSQLNLTFFMLVGYAQANWLVLVFYFLGAGSLIYSAYVQKGAFLQRAYLQQALAITLWFAVFLFLTLPWMTGSSLFFLGYWVDWILLFLMSIGYAAASFVWIYPSVKLYETYLLNKKDKF